MIRRIITAVLSFLLVNAICHGQVVVFHGQVTDSLPPPPPDPQIDTNNIFNRTSYDGGWGDVPQGWKRQQRILRESTDSDLDSLARYATYPAERVFAFYSLAEKKSERCYSILLDRLTDKDWFWYWVVDLGWKETVGDFMLNTIWQYDGLYTPEQIHTIDSLAVFEPGMEHLDKYRSALRLYGTDGLYDRVREFYLHGESQDLQILATYRKPEDIPLIFEALKEYDLYDDWRTNKRSRTIEGLDAVLKWPDDIFIPLLEEIRDYELTNGYANHYRVERLFKIAMAYDNDWSYGFIEDCFKNKESEGYYVFTTSLYNVYYYDEKEANESFFPLVKKYGKKPYNWDDMNEQQ